MSRNTGVSPEVVQTVMVRSYGKCEALIEGVCTHNATQVHHRRPRGSGGTRRPETNWAANLVHLCLACHERIESRRAWATTNGFLVSQFAWPADVPVWWRCARTRNGAKRLRLLRDDGTMTDTPNPTTKETTP